MKQDSIQSRYRWIMLFLLWLLYIAFGLVARSITPLITPILNDLRMTYSQMGFILGSWQLTYILVALMEGAPYRIPPQGRCKVSRIWSGGILKKTV